MSQVAYGGRHIIIERKGKSLAALVSVDDLELIERKRAASTRAYGALALVGAWREVGDQDIDSLIADLYVQREGDTGRYVELKD